MYFIGIPYLPALFVDIKPFLWLRISNPEIGLKKNEFMWFLVINEVSVNVQSATLALRLVKELPTLTE